MFKYLFVTRISLMEFLTYRLNFILWRVRVVVSILITFFLWQAIYGNRQQVFNYYQNQMITYIILLNVVSGLVLSTRTSNIAEEINRGNLSNFLLLPFNYFYYNLFRDFADKLINIFFSIFEVIFIIYVFKPQFLFQFNPYYLLLFFASLILAVFLYFFINLLLSFIAFWSREVWAPRFIFFIIISFLAGTYFPLDIVPNSVYSLISLLPFTYLLFFPIKIYLGQFNATFLIKGFSISLIWLIILYFFSKKVWQARLKIYTAVGK